MSEENQVVKKGTKIIINEEEHVLEEDMSIDELLEVIKEDPSYKAATRENLYDTGDGTIEVSSPKSATHGV